MIDPLIDLHAFSHFDPNASQWDPFNAYALAQLSELSYGTDTDISAVLTAWGFNNRFMPPSTANDIRVIAAARGDLLVIVYRGTISEKNGHVDLSNWKTDADVTQVPMNHFFPKTDGMVHRGFAEALNEVWEPTIRAVKAYGNRPLWVTGHSLGGGMAHLAAVALKSQGINVQGLYTYGQPKAGDHSFCKQHVRNYHRVVNNEDLVTRIPRFAFHLPIEFYRHTGHLTYFDATGKVFHQERFWHDLFAELKLRRCSLVDAFADQIDDHFMRGYSTNLRNLVIHFK